MMMLCKKLAPILLLLVACTMIEAGLTADYADARSSFGGRSFRMIPRSPSRSVGPTTSPYQSGGTFRRGMAGGLLGGALGALLFGSMFGAGGSGMGILPLLILGGIAYLLFKRYSQQGRNHSQSYYQQPSGQSPGGQGPVSMFGGAFGSSGQSPPFTPDIGGNLVEEGIEQIRTGDRGFDPTYFQEVASDVFFQVQAGWMRRDLNSYRHLLGDQLAAEYERHFAEMRRKGHINKLESIAIRNVEIVGAGSDGREDFVTVSFLANLLDYTVDDTSGELVEGSRTTPVKFNEEWTWARPTGTENWKLEGIKVV